jgi:hypothetical protein
MPPEDEIHMAVMALAGALSLGEPDEEIERLTREAAAGTGAEDEAVRAAALRLLTTDPEMRQHLATLDGYLEYEGESEYARLALPLAGEAALAAASIDLERALHEATLYIDSYPKEGIVVGHLGERASLWLAERMTMTEDVDAARPRMRRAVAAYADAAAEEFPRASAALRGVLETPQPERAVDDELWLAFAQRIVGRRLVSGLY